MKQDMMRAMEDFRIATHLTAKPILTCLGILDFAELTGNASLAKRMLDWGNRLDPKNFDVRYLYMDSLQSRWGGSLAAMMAFRRELDSVGYSDDQLGQFDGMIDSEQRWLACCGHS